MTNANFQKMRNNTFSNFNPKVNNNSNNLYNNVNFPPPTFQSYGEIPQNQYLAIPADEPLNIDLKEKV